MARWPCGCGRGQAMTRREPDGISTEAWDALVSEIGETLGVGNA